MSNVPPLREVLHHHTREMRGRDVRGAHRVATPLELLFDLTFVISFGLRQPNMPTPWQKIISLPP